MELVVGCPSTCGGKGPLTLQRRSIACGNQKKKTRFAGLFFLTGLRPVLTGLRPVLPLSPGDRLSTYGQLVSMEWSVHLPVGGKVS